MKASKKNPLGLKISIAIIVTAFSVVFADAVFGVLFPVPMQSLFLHSTKGWSAGNISIEDFFKSPNFRGSEKLGYELVPNSKLGTNCLGMLDKPRGIAKKADVLRIICLGDSTTANRPGYPMLLETYLNKKNDQISFEVWNCGVPGYGSIQECNALFEKWLACNPDIVVFGFCLNDFDTTPVVLREGGHLVGYFPYNEPEIKINPFLVKYSAVYRKLISEPFLFQNKYSPRNVFDLTETAFLNVKSALQQRNIPFFVVIFGLPVKFEQYSEHDIEQYEKILDLLKENEIDHIDMVPIFEANDPKSLMITPKDKIHFNENGNILIVNEIAAFLRNKYGHVFEK